jgi:hypothetical protein
MESLDALLFMRMTERLLGLLAGALCVVLGYRLFINLPDKVDSSGKVVLPGGISIWLSRVGPGVFFALFGAAIVGYSFTSTVKATSEQSAAPATTASGTTGSTTGQPAATIRQEIAAMSDRAGGPASKEVREQQLTVLRGVMADLNATIVRLERDAPAPERERLIGGLQTAKMLLLKGNWEPGWGDPLRLQSWINSGAMLPAPAGMDMPAGLYLAGRS